jgi:hypothetical protein
MVFGKLCKGNSPYISFLPSPSNPPNVIVGLEEEKNHSDPERRQYQAHIGLIKR